MGLLGWVRGGFVSQTCYAKTTVALIKTNVNHIPLCPLLCELATTSTGCGSRILLLQHFWSSFSEFSMRWLPSTAERTGNKFSVRTQCTTCGSLVPPCGHGKEKRCSGST